MTYICIVIQSKRYYISILISRSEFERQWWRSMHNQSMHNGRYVQINLCRSKIKTAKEINIGFQIRNHLLHIKILAGYILRKLDETADPCEDMVQFACGGWFESNEIPPSESRVSLFSEVGSRIDSILRGNFFSGNVHMEESRIITCF